MSLPFIDLKKQYALIEADIGEALNRVLQHGRFIMGPEVGILEQELSEYVGVRHAVACASGTDALLLPLMALGVGPGDAVFTPPFTFVSTVEVICLLGARPVFVDIRPDTFNLDPDRLGEAIRTVREEGRYRPAAVMPVDLFGQTADYDAIAAPAEEAGLLVIEDAAQSFGARYHNRPAGGLAPVGATSFFPAKPLGCYGDGGAVFTNDDDLAEAMASIRVHGQGREKYEYLRLGLNARMDTLQAAVLSVKLKIFPEELERRQSVAARYTRNLAGTVQTPFIEKHNLSSWAQYSVLSDQRDLCMSRLKDQGIPTAIYYPRPLHLQPPYQGFGRGKGDFPVSEEIANKIFSLPMHPYLTDEEIDRISAAVIDAVASAA